MGSLVEGNYKTKLGAKIYFAKLGVTVTEGTPVGSVAKKIKI